VMEFSIWRTLGSGEFYIWGKPHSLRCLVTSTKLG
jgi:hypothetical protein